jgi:hypothetical protein
MNTIAYLTETVQRIVGEEAVYLLRLYTHLLQPFVF